MPIREQIQPSSQPSPLPTGYTQLEYIEGTGTQHLYLPSFAMYESDEVTVDWMPLPNPNTSGNNTHPLVCSDGQSKRYYIYGYFKSTPPGWWIYMQQGNVSASPLFAYTSNVRVTLTWNRTSFTDGINTTTYNASYNQCYVGTHFGAHWQSWGDYYGCIGKYRFYRITINTYNGIPRLDLIPALRIADSKPGMYDLVNNQFLTNAGSGEFLYA